MTRHHYLTSQHILTSPARPYFGQAQAQPAKRHSLAALTSGKPLPCPTRGAYHERLPKPSQPAGTALPGLLWAFGRVFKNLGRALNYLGAGGKWGGVGPARVHGRRVHGRRPGLADLEHKFKDLMQISRRASSRLYRDSRLTGLTDGLAWLLPSLCGISLSCLGQACSGPYHADRLASDWLAG